MQTNANAKILNNKNVKVLILADYLFLGAAFVSFLLSVYLWFGSNKEQGIFVGLWVPSIIGLGVYFRVILGKYSL